MKKTFKVVMLPTEKASNLYIETMGELEYLTSEELVAGRTNQHLYIISDDEPKIGDWVKHGVIDEVYEVNTFNLRATLHNKSKKIVASSDKSLFFRCGSCDGVGIIEEEPCRTCVGGKTGRVCQIPYSFMVVYAKFHREGRKIIEVDLEMEYKVGGKDLTHGNSHITPSLVIKTRPDNTVIFHTSKLYKAEEMYENMQYYMEYCQLKGYVTPQDWIEKHKHF